MNKRVIVFAPHPDDETLGCGGTIMKKQKDGYDVLVVILTDGRNAFSDVLGIDTDPSPEKLKEIRREEVKRAMKILSVKQENLRLLDFEDETLEKNEERAKEQVLAILKENLPVEVYFPYEKDSHPDHRATNRIVRDSIRGLGQNARSYRYSIMQKYGRLGPLKDAFLNLFKHNMIDVDVSECLQLKRLAIKEFESELLIISSRQKKPVLQRVERLLGNKEIFYIDK